MEIVKFALFFARPVFCLEDRQALINFLKSATPKNAQGHTSYQPLPI